MANVQHNALTDPNLHEPKGVSSANADEVYIATGGGTGTWAKLSPTSFNGLATNGNLGQFLVSTGAGGLTYTTAAHGDIYFYNIGAPHVVTYPSSFTKINPTTTVSGTYNSVTEGTNARLTYIGLDTITLDIVYSVSLSQSSGASRDVEVALYKNGVYINGSSSLVTTGSAEKHSMSNHSSSQTSTNDYFEIFVKNLGASGDVNVYMMNLSVTVAGT